MKITYFICLALLLGATSVFAQNLDFFTSTPLVKALDTDNDRALSISEINAAASTLLSLDKNGDGIVSDLELGGPGSFPGWTRLQTPVRVIDINGDLQFSAAEILESTARLIRLDMNKDNRLSAEELVDGRVLRMRRTGGGPPFARRLPGGMIESMLNVILNNPEVTDPILPGRNKEAWDGYLFFVESNIASDIQVANAGYLVDMNGRVVHTWTNSRGAPEGTSGYLLENGLLLRQSAPDDWILMEHFRVGAHGIVELVDWDGNIVWQYRRAKVGEHCLHHDLEPLPNGNILVMSYEAFSSEDVRAMGWDPDKARTAGRGSSSETNSGLIWLEKILELKPNLQDGSTEIVWEWNSWDHLVQEADPKKPNYGKVRDHSGRIDLNFRPMKDALLHFNSIDYHPELDQIMVSSLLFNEIWILDHGTTTEEAAGSKGGRYGKGGEILYRWGNPVAHAAGSEEDKVLQGQHDARWLVDLPGNGGHLTIHNNVAGSIQGARGKTMFQMGARYSGVIELKLPIEADGSYLCESGKPCEGEVVWQYTAKPPASWYAPFMSGASRLPNGNTLVVNSHNKRIFEITPKGERVLDFNVSGLGRMFRVYKYPADYPGLDGRKLLPGKSIVKDVSSALEHQDVFAEKPKGNRP